MGLAYRSQIAWQGRRVIPNTCFFLYQNSSSMWLLSCFFKKKETVTMTKYCPSLLNAFIPAEADSHQKP